MANEYVLTGYVLEGFATQDDGVVTLTGYAVEGFASHEVSGIILTGSAIEVYMTNQQAYRADFVDFIAEGFPDNTGVFPPSYEQFIQYFRPNFTNELPADGLPAYPRWMFLYDTVPTIPAELNPYRPDIPQQVNQVAPDLYDFLRENAEIQRTQHNITQAGDTTFPWETTTRPTDRKQFNLGSLTRLYHETYGIVYARFVQFSERWDGVKHSFVGQDTKTSTEYVVTNQLQYTRLDRTLGLSLPYNPDVNGLWGWVQVGGRGLQDIIIESNNPQIGEMFTWDYTNRICVTGNGPAVCYLRDTTLLVEKLDLDGLAYSPKRWTVPAGSWILMTGVNTNEFYIDLAETAFAPYVTRIEVLEAALAEDAVDYQSQIDALSTTVSANRALFNAHESSNQLTFVSVTNRLLNLEDAVALLSGGSGTDLSVYEARLSAVEAISANNATNITGLDGRVTTLEYELGLLSAGYASGIIYSIANAVTISGTNVQTALDQVDAAITAMESTGYLSGGGLSDQGAGVIRIDLGEGVILDNSVPAIPVYYPISWVLTDLNLSGADGVYYIYVDSTGVVQSTTVAPTTADYDSKIWLYAVIIVASVYDSSFNIQQPTRQLARQLREKASLSGATFTGDVQVPDEAYGAGWDGSTEVPTKNAVYDKIQTIGGGGGSIAVEDDGVEIVASASRFNFTGVGVTVTDSGSGEVEINIPGGGGGIPVPTIVQSKIVALANLSSGVTLDSAPTEGNILFAIIFNAVATTPPGNTSGWTTLVSNSSLPDHLANWRVIGASETTIQTPTTSSDGGIIAIYEIEGTVAVQAGNVANGTTTSLAFNFSGNGEYLAACQGLGIVYSGRRDVQSCTWSGFFTGHLSLIDDGTIVGGTGLSVATGKADVAPNDPLSATALWSTAVASKVDFVIIA